MLKILHILSSMLFFNIYTVACIMQYLVVCGLFDDPVNILHYLEMFVE